MLAFIRPSLVQRYSLKLLPYLSVLMVAITSVGIFKILSSPDDYLQGELVKIMYIHVPAAWLALGIYVFMGVSCAICLIWRSNFAFILAKAAAPIGASFAFITLITGMIWGLPTWGALWVWDARLTSMLVLFLFYLIFILVANASNSLHRAQKPASIISIFGLINVPIVKFSVNLWSTLHQGASVFKPGGPSIHTDMLVPLFIMFTSFALFFIISLILRLHTIINHLKQKRR